MNKEELKASLNLIVKASGNFKYRAFCATPYCKKPSKKLAALMNKGASEKLTALLNQKDALVDAVIKRDRATAVLTMHQDKQSIPGIVFPHLSLDFNPRSPKSLKDMESLLGRHQKKFDKDTINFALADHENSRRVLEKFGFAIESVILVGPVKAGLNNLVKKVNPPKDLKAFGLTIQKVGSVKDINAILKLEKREFERNPKFGEWVSNPEYQKVKKKNLLSDLRKGTLNGFVIKNRNKIVGYFGFYPFPESPAYPKGASVEITLDQSIQGRGIAKTCYLFMLKQMTKQNIKFIRGATGQLAVMGIGKILKRKPFGYMMRYRSKYFDSKHFVSAK